MRGNTSKTDWRTSPAHLVFLSTFLRSRSPTDPRVSTDWAAMLGEKPEDAIKRFLDAGALVPASLSEHVHAKFNATELRDLLKQYGLPSSGTKDDLILRLIHAHPQDMKKAVEGLTMLQCSDRGREVAEHYLLHEAENHIRNGIVPRDVGVKVARWILDAAGAGVIGAAAYDALTKLVSRDQLGSEPSETRPSNPETVATPDIFRTLPKSFRNALELNAEYIHIPPGSFTYSVSEKTESVPDLYFAKYPVTNKRYRQFISYLAGANAQLRGMLPLESYAAVLRAVLAKHDVLTFPVAEPGRLAQWFRPRRDLEKEFKGDDQPAVGVSWFEATAYCLWLSMLEASAHGIPVNELGYVFRLPAEIEWEWGAAGRQPDGTLRKYPWAPEKGGPSHKLANYEGNVGGTTAVGRYPDGATPEGLMDMAGNVWEWMEDRHDDRTGVCFLRGGSWDNDEGCLRCSARANAIPEFRLSGFGVRVLCSQY